MPSTWRVGGFILIGTIVFACGSSERNPFDSADGGTPSAAADPQGLADGGSSPGNLLCDETRLREARSPAGCRFLTTEVSWSGDRLPNWEPEGCHPLLVNNPSTQAVHLRLRFQDREEDAAPYSTIVTVNGLDATYSPLKGGVLQPFETAVVSIMYASRLPGDPTNYTNSFCPSKAFVDSRAPAARHEAVTNAVELSADAPVLVFHVHDFQPSTKAGIPDTAPTTLYPIFPTHLFATAVLETGIFRPGLPAELTSQADGGSVPYVTAPVRRVVVSAFDGTRVALVTPDGTTRSVSLQRGEVWADDPNDALIGRSVSANLPVGVLSFAPNALIPWNFPIEVVEDDRRALSAAFPEALWGSEYVAVRHGDRWSGKPEMPPWRIIGGTDGTKLSYDPAMPDGAPTEIQRGELAVFYADAPFVVRSQDDAHAFYLAGHMTGPQYQKQRFGLGGDDASDLRGSAVSLHAVPSSRWVRGYSFFGLPTYPNLNLVVIRKSHGADVELDCAGNLTGWQPVGSSYEYTRVALTGPLYEPLGGCTAGAHRIKSTDPFTATVWAWGDGETSAALNIWSYGAYGFPVLGVDPISTPEAH